MGSSDALGVLTPLCWAWRCRDILLKSVTLVVPRGSVCASSTALHRLLSPSNPPRAMSSHVAAPGEQAPAPLLAAHPLPWQEGRRRRDKWQWVGMHKRCQAGHPRANSSSAGSCSWSGGSDIRADPPGRCFGKHQQQLWSPQHHWGRLWTQHPGWGDWRAVPAGTTLPP